MSEGNSYRQILRSTSIIGGASVINILVGLLRTKVAAVLLGPAGVGLIGLFTNLTATASTVAGLGFGNVGTRQIAQASASGDEGRVFIARRALFWGTLGLALMGAIAFWCLREVLAQQAMHDAALAGDIGWLAIAVGLSVASASQNALLNGMRRISDIARVSVGSALLATTIGVIALWLWGRSGIVAFVIAAPLAAFVLGHWYVSKLPRSHGGLQLRELAREWSTLARLGFAFMVAGLAGTVGQLVVRLLVQRELGVEALGQFQAAWAISMTYIGFVLGAMGTDYYPRLTAIIDDHDAANKLINEQTEVALLLATPVLLAMLALAPWVIRLLYTAEFSEAAMVLRWQVLGDFLKIASWPLGFILLAAGAGRTFMLTEWIAMGGFVLFTWLGLPLIGIKAAGVAFVGLYAVYLPLVFWLARRRTGFTWSRAIAWHLLLANVAALVLVGIADWSPIAAALVGVPLAGMAAVFGLARLGTKLGLGGRLGWVAAKSNSILVKMRQVDNG